MKKFRRFFSSSIYQTVCCRFRMFNRAHSIQTFSAFLVFSIAFSSVFLFSGCYSSNDEKNPIIKAMLTNAYKKEPCEWKEISLEYNDFSVPETITHAQLKSDIEHLCYLLKTAYAGYEASCERGLNLDEITEKTLSHFEGKEIHPKDVAKFLFGELEYKIRDTHFKITSGDYWWTLCGHERIYFTDVYLKKDDAGNFRSIKDGALYGGSEENLFLYGKCGESEEQELGGDIGKIYRLGTISAENPKTMKTVFNGKSVELPIKTEVPIQGRETLRFGQKETENSAYISLSHFSVPASDSKYRDGTDKQFDRFVDSAADFQNKKNVIVDVRSNRGGNEGYVIEFLTNLYVPKFEIKNRRTKLAFVKQFNSLITPISSDCFQIFSPAVEQAFLSYFEQFYPNDKGSSFAYSKLNNYFQKNPECLYVKSFDTNSKNAKFKLPDSPAFEGKLIIILDRNCCSTTESFVRDAKVAFGNQVVVVGENSAGCIEYGNIFDYKLPESNIIVGISSATFAPSFSCIENWHGEGFGIYPDVWSTGEDLLETLVSLTDDEDLREKIPYIERALQ